MIRIIVPEESIQPIIYIISDSTGETAQSIINAAISQFDTEGIKLKLFAHIESIKDIKGIIEKIRPDKSFIIFTIVKPELRLFLKEEAQSKSIFAFDLLGPLLENIERISGISPKLTPGLLRKIDKQYFKRMEAMEFAVKYDACQGELDLTPADVVILGVSRTSKTPLSMYLAHKGVKVANIILEYEVEPPISLNKAPREKIIGLTIEPDNLIEIRMEQLRILGLSDQSVYTDKERVIKEINYAHNIYKKIGCRIINITNKAIEDIATQIMEMIGGEKTL